MSDLKAMRKRADLAIREQANIVLLPEQFAAFIACAEALQAFVDANTTGKANEWIHNMTDCHKQAGAALAALKEAP